MRTCIYLKDGDAGNGLGRYERDGGARVRFWVFLGPLFRGRGMGLTVSPSKEGGKKLF